MTCYFTSTLLSGEWALEPYFTVMAEGRWTPFAKRLKILDQGGGIKNKGYSNFHFSGKK